MARKLDILSLAKFTERQNFLNRRQEALLRDAGRMEKLLYDAIFGQLAKELTTSSGIITIDNNAIRLSTLVDSVFDRFENSEQLKSARQMAGDFLQLNTLNGDYFDLYNTGSIKKFEAIKTTVFENMAQRMGVDGEGKFIKGGYLDGLIKDRSLRQGIKDSVVRAATDGTTSLPDLTKFLKINILGIPESGVDGGLVSYYKQFAYDTYQQYDRAMNDQFAKELELEAFVYTGGLIETSRDFCIEKNTKVFTRDEALNDWPKDKNLPKTKAEKKSGSTTDYRPLEDCGRWNCRHMVRFISNELAISMRPDLESVLQ